MAVTEARKLEIRTDWQMGEFKTIVSLAKHHKITSKTAKKILVETRQDSLKQIVNLGIEYYLKLYSMPYNEVVNFIEKSVDDEIHSMVEFKKTKDLISNNIFIINLLVNKMIRRDKKSVIVGGQIHEVELSSSDLLTCINIIDQSLISSGLAQRFATSPTVSVINNISTTVPQKRISNFYQETKEDDD